MGMCGGRVIAGPAPPPPAPASTGGGDDLTTAIVPTLPGPTHKCARTLKAHQGAARCCAFNPGGSHVVTGGDDRAVRLWNPAKAPHPDALVKTYVGPHGYAVHGVCVAADSSRFASCGADKCAFVWDVESGKVGRRLYGHDHNPAAGALVGSQCVNCVAFNAHEGRGTVLVTGGYDRTVRCWDLRAQSRGAIQVLDQFADSVTSVLVGGDWIVAGSVDGCVRRFDLRRARVATDHVGEPVGRIALAGDGRHLLAACLDGALRLLPVAGAGGAGAGPPASFVHGRSLRRSAHLEPGTVVAPPTPLPVLNEYRGHVNRAYAIGACFTATDAHVVAASEDGRLCAWDLLGEGQQDDNGDDGKGGGKPCNNRPVRNVHGAHRRCVSDVACHPRGGMFTGEPACCAVSTSFDGTLNVWAASEAAANRSAAAALAAGDASAAGSAGVYSRFGVETTTNNHGTAGIVRRFDLPEFKPAA